MGLIGRHLGSRAALHSTHFHGSRGTRGMAMGANYVDAPRFGPAKLPTGHYRICIVLPLDTAQYPSPQSHVRRIPPRELVGMSLSFAPGTRAILCTGMITKYADRGRPSRNLFPLLPACCWHQPVPPLAPWRQGCSPEESRKVCSCGQSTLSLLKSHFNSVLRQSPVSSGA